MNVKILTTSAATAALVSAIGLAYAQSSSDPATPPATGGSTIQQPAPNTTTPAPATTLPDASAPASPRNTDTTTSSTRSDGTMQAPAPRADRG